MTAESDRSTNAPSARTRSDARCAVLGSPIGHSLSPVLHRAAYVELGLRWTYDRVEVDEAGLADFVEGLDRRVWRGLSLTMPLKVAALSLGVVDEIARLAEAGNTIIFDGAEPQIFNTDVAGLTWALRRAGATAVDAVIILGAGATARSALLSVAQLDASQIVVVARTPSRAAGLVELGARVGVEVGVRSWEARLPQVDLVISTAPAGAADARSEEIAARAGLIFDAIYDPWPTTLAVAAARAGRTVISGRDLLIGQALIQIELMTGRSVAPDVLYAALADC